MKPHLKSTHPSPDADDEAMRLRRSGCRSGGVPQSSVVSDLDLSLLPHDKIFKRELHQWSVHHSLTTYNWIATIVTASGLIQDPTKPRYVQFPFLSEREARRFCKAYSPPKLMAAAQNCDCKLCKQPLVNPRNCRNCGVTVCDPCSARWGIRMVPKTYISVQNATNTVLVCKSCDWLSNAFCMSLLQGRYRDALTLYETVSGNVFCCEIFSETYRPRILTMLRRILLLPIREMSMYALALLTYIAKPCSLCIVLLWEAHWNCCSGW
jgi:hypothetical protein